VESGEEERRGGSVRVARETESDKLKCGGYRKESAQCHLLSPVPASNSGGPLVRSPHRVLKKKNNGIAINSSSDSENNRTTHSYEYRII
jgi:hypothetical protein